MIKKVFKNYLDLFLLLILFHLPSCELELRKRFALRLLLVCLAVGDFVTFCLWIANVSMYKGGVICGVVFVWGGERYEETMVLNFITQVQLSLVVFCSYIFGVFETDSIFISEYRHKKNMHLYT